MSVSSDEEVEIYEGPRDGTFRDHIRSLLKRSSLEDEFVNEFTDDDAMEIYNQAFTSPTADPVENYEIYEQLGDGTANKFIVWYACRRFPQLFCTLGVKVIARLRINYGAKQSFFKIAQDHGFWPFITASVEERSKKMKDLLEDSLEAFCGATEWIIDLRRGKGVGSAVMYEVLESLFNELDISLLHKDLYDNKTRLKELFDAFPHLGTWAYINTRDETLARATVYWVPKGVNKVPIKTEGNSHTGDVITIHNPRREWIKIGNGSAAKKSDAEQAAAGQGIISMNKKGYSREPAPEYAAFHAGYNFTTMIYPDPNYQSSSSDEKDTAKKERKEGKEGKERKERKEGKERREDKNQVVGNPRNITSNSIPSQVKTEVIDEQHNVNNRKVRDLCDSVMETFPEYEM